MASHDFAPVDPPLTSILEAALLAAGRPLSLADLENLFGEAERPPPGDFRRALTELAEDCRSRPIELIQVASGYRLQVRQAFSPWVSRLFEARGDRYSRALLETLSIIAYRQPATRGDIEDIRGVAVSASIIDTLLERGWIRAVGQRDAPGRPTLFATTQQFLDYFNLKSLGELPPLQEMDSALAAFPESHDPAGRVQADVPATEVRLGVAPDFMDAESSRDCSPLEVK